MSTIEAVANDATEFAEHTKLLAGDVKDIAVDSTEHIVTVVKNNPRLIIIAGVVGLGVGAVVGFKYAEKKFVSAFELRLEQEMEAARNIARLRAEVDKDVERQEKFFAEAAAQSKRPARAFRDAAVANGSMTEANALLRKHGYTTEEIEVERSSVMINGEPLSDDFDYEAEKKLRSPDRPYVISHDEFLENLIENSQVSIVYYVGDDILADEREEPVDADFTVGVHNLQRFGHGSRDSNIVYVRNEKLDLDFEVTRHLGSFGEEVMGYTKNQPE